MAALFCLLIAFCTPAPGAWAQGTAPTIVVTGGEHRGFTRIVLQSPRAFTWSVQPEGRQVQVLIGPPTTRLDLRRAFDRIARQRLTAIEQTATGLVLTLGCDCQVRAFEERAGVVVFDIMSPGTPPADPAPGAQEPGTPPDNAAMPDAPPVAPMPPRTGTTIDPDALTRRAGQALAETLRHRDRSSGGEGAAFLTRAPPTESGRMQLPGAAPGDTPSGAGDATHDTDTARMGSAVALRLAEAVAQGVLAGAGDAPQGARLTPGPTLGSAPEQALQLRVLTPLQPGGAEAEIARAPEACQQDGVLAFLSLPETAPFAQAQGRLMQSLHGEFDRPDEGALLDLVHLYLQHGFGAEARQLIDTAREPIAGHDLLRGLADLLEGRQSNSRMLLSALAGCAGPAGLVAALAGAPRDSISASADALALTYGTLRDPLKRIVAQDLVALLIDVGALDQARIVLGQMQAAGPAGVSDPPLPQALLNHARGAHGEATRALDHQSGADDAAALRLRLRLLRDTGASADPALIEQAQTLAGMLRHSDDGIALLSDVIHLQAVAGAFVPGFASLDRLRTWLGQTPGDRQIDQVLTDTMWQQVVERAEDQAFLALYLTRDDGRRADLSPATRTGLATRLLRLGLAQAAAGLVSPPTDPAQTLVLAEALIATDRAEQVLALLAPLMAPPDERNGTETSSAQILMAQTLFARALRDQGATDTAIAAFIAGGASHEAARLAMATGDWRQLEALLAQPPAAQQSRPAERGRPALGLPQPVAGGALPPTDAADASDLAGSLAALNAPPESQAALLALTRLLLAAPGEAERAPHAPPSGEAVLPALATGAAVSADPAPPPAPLGGPPSLADAPFAPATTTAPDPTALAPPLPAATFAPDAPVSDSLASGAFAPDAFAAGASPAPAADPENAEAALMRRNATLLGQSAALRTLVEALLAEGE